MKKVLALVLILIMILSLAGCGGNKMTVGELMELQTNFPDSFDSGWVNKASDNNSYKVFYASCITGQDAVMVNNNNYYFTLANDSLTLVSGGYKSTCNNKTATFMVDRNKQITKIILGPENELASGTYSPN